MFSRRRIALDVPRPASVIHRLVREADPPATFTTSVALRAWLPEAVLPITELSQVVAYTPDGQTLGGALRARPVSIARAPLVLLPVTDATAPRIARDDPRWGPVVSVPRAMVDLMTSGGRGTEEAEQLLVILAERDARWKRGSPIPHTCWRGRCSSTRWRDWPSTGRYAPTSNDGVP